MKKYIISLTVLLGLTSCETFDLDSNLQNPNYITLDQADPDKLLNAVQIGVGDVYRNASNIGMSLTRMANPTYSGLWDNYLTPTSSNTMWYGYISVIGRAETLRKQTAGKNQFHHDGISRVLEAYTLLTLVDFYGDVFYLRHFKDLRIAILKPIQVNKFMLMQ